MKTVPIQRLYEMSGSEKEGIGPRAFTLMLAIIAILILFTGVIIVCSAFGIDLSLYNK